MALRHRWATFRVSSSVWGKGERADTCEPCVVRRLWVNLSGGSPRPRIVAQSTANIPYALILAGLSEHLETLAASAHHQSSFAASMSTMSPLWPFATTMACAH